MLAIILQSLNTEITNKILYNTSVLKISIIFLKVEAYSIRQIEMYKNYIEQFSIQASKNSLKPAIIFNEKIITYQDLNLYSDNLAQHLLNSNAKPEQIIPLILERDETTIISMLGILKAGCAFLPISPITPCSRIKFILDDTNAKIVISNSKLENIIDSNRIIVPNDFLSTAAQTFQIPSIPQNSIAYVMYTSGSTGNPKGVLIEHHSMMNLFESLIEKLNITSQDQFIALTDYTFDISLIELLMPLLQGATIILTEQGTVADGTKIKEYLRKYNISIMQATPLTWEILIKQGWKNKNTMKILVGGEKFKTSLAEALDYQYGNIWNMYGPTETSMWSMYNNLSNKISTESVPLGSPLRNTTIKILDSDLMDVGKNIQGDLFIGGDGLARGYLNNEALTNEKFIYHPKTRERLYKTGDLAIDIEHAGVCYVGRTDDQLKFGGIRIEAGEIEAFIEQEPLVKKAVVKIHETDDYYKTLAAYIEIDEGQIFSKEIHAANLETTTFMKNIYNETYLLAEKYEHGNINNCGWQSSFNGELFSGDELIESYEYVRKEIAQSNLKSVLEAGCGTGSLLANYIDQAENCTIVEISEKAIDYVQKKLTKKQRKKVDFRNESLVNIHEHYKYTCIIVNSVLQYLPSVEAVITTIKQLVNSTISEGKIILGDIRSLELMEIYLLEKMRLNNDNTEELTQHLNTFYYKSRDAEITLSPKFFYVLQNIVSDISYVDINVKHGNYVNELNYFRYDVILHIRKNIDYISALTLKSDDVQNQSQLQKLSYSHQETPILIREIPNLYTQRIIDNINFSINHIFLEFQKLKIANNNINQNLFYDPQNYPMHDIFLNYNEENPYNKLDLYLCPKHSSKTIRMQPNKTGLPLNAYYREPFNPWLQQFCFEHIKLKIKQNILSWVSPSVYVWIEKWPISINGKLDKKKLMLPLGKHLLKNDSKVIEQLQNIWRNITGDDIFLDKEFWTHGVSSLSMYFFLANINEIFLVSINYHEFREHNTLEKLAQHIEKLLDLQGIVQ